jgi:pilus assembly protein CpaB
MLLAAVLAFATNLVVLRNHDETRAVVVAARDVPAGRALTGSDLRSVEVDVDDQLFTTLIPWQESRTVLGQVAARAIGNGHIINNDDVRPASAPGGLRAMSIPIESEHAVGGALVVGDRIDLIAVDDAGPRYVLTDAEVVAIPGVDRGSFTGVGGFYLVVAVDPLQALAVAAAIRDGGIEVVRTTGADQVELETP